MDQETIDKAYYKPKESELIMGYECKIHVPKYEGHKFIVDEDQMQYACFCIRAGFLYTKYLTKEDIQAEGWTLGELCRIYWSFEKDNVKLFFYEQTHEVRIYKVDFSRETTQEGGFKDDIAATFKCPSINEFRYICKLLGI
jgi:hypothetical protein